MCSDFLVTFRLPAGLSGSSFDAAAVGRAGNVEAVYWEEPDALRVRSASGAGTLRCIEAFVFTKVAARPAFGIERS